MGVNAGDDQNLVRFDNEAETAKRSQAEIGQVLAAYGAYRPLGARRSRRGSRRRVRTGYRSAIRSRHPPLPAAAAGAAAAYPILATTLTGTRSAWSIATSAPRRGSTRSGLSTARLRSCTSRVRPMRRTRSASSIATSR